MEDSFIENGAEEYASKTLLYEDYIIHGDMVKRDFTAGVKWALDNLWIPVEKEFPKENGTYFVKWLAMDKVMYSSAYFIDEHTWDVEGYGFTEVTHWMKIPK